jgi:hypothetical protein
MLPDPGLAPEASWPESNMTRRVGGLRYYDQLADRVMQFAAARAASSLSWRPRAIRPVARGRVKGITPKPLQLEPIVIRPRSPAVEYSDIPKIPPLPRGVFVRRIGAQIAPRVEVPDIPTVISLSDEQSQET